MNERNVAQISIGGWFQRTVLHLSEIYDFLKYAESPLDLDQSKLKAFRDGINPQDLTLHVGELDHVTFSAENNILVKIFEDGLVTLHTNHVSGLIKDEIDHLTNFYEEKVSPAFSYLFSLGAPVPKELANIKTIYPYFVTFNNETKENAQSVFADLDEQIHYTIEKNEFDIYRGDKLYVINNKQDSPKLVESFIEELIFTREFRGQMHRYLNLHRIIWEQIADVKERGSIKGNEIAPFKGKIEHYSKSINLIGARIEQMGVYIGTRGTISRKHLSESEFIEVVGFRYETLANTLEYVKNIWNMTVNYVKSADKLFGDLQASATSKSIQSLTVVTSMGVGAALLDLFNTGQPEISRYGIVYVFILAAIGYGVSRVMKWWGLSKNYSIEQDELSVRE